MSDPSSDAGDTRRGVLNGIKLRAVVAERFAGETISEASPFAPGAALVHSGSAWVYLDGDAGQHLGSALAWMIRSGADSLNLIAESDTGLLARRGAEFSTPISVWQLTGRSLAPSIAAPFVEAIPALVAHEAFRSDIVAGGAEPVVEHGVLAGEVLGLEVCRVVDDPETGDARLEVGIGAHDREAFRMLHGDAPTVDSLARVVEAVSGQRQNGIRQHPLNRLSAERLIRWRLLHAPQMVDAVSLAPAAPPVRRDNLKDAVPCLAVGRGVDDEIVIVVCSSGVDLELVPYAADARAAVMSATPGAEGRLVIVTPARDRLRVTEDLADLLGQPAEFVSLD